MTPTTPPPDPIPGFTKEQSWAMNVVAEHAADRAIAKLQKGPCPVECTSMDAVQTVVFGRTERGISGLDSRVADLERAMANLKRVTWVAVSALIASVIGLIITLAQGPLTGG